MDTETILRVFSQIKKPITKTKLSNQNVDYFSIDDSYRIKISDNSYLTIHLERNISENIRYYVDSFLQKEYYFHLEINQNIDFIYKEYLEDPSLWILTYGKIKLPDFIKDEWVYEIAEFSKFLQTKE